MKPTALLLLLSLLATTSFAQKASKEEAAIRAAMQAQEAAWNAGDIERFVELSYVQRLLPIGATENKSRQRRRWR